MSQGLSTVDVRRLVNWQIGDLIEASTVEVEDNDKQINWTLKPNTRRPVAGRDVLSFDKQTGKVTYVRGLGSYTFASLYRELTRAGARS